MMLACQEGRLQMIKVLAIADFSLTGKVEMWTLLILAIKNNHFDCVSYLAGIGVLVDSISSKQFMSCAIS